MARGWGCCLAGRSWRPWRPWRPWRSVRPWWWPSWRLSWLRPWRPSGRRGRGVLLTHHILVLELGGHLVIQLLLVLRYGICHWCGVKGDGEGQWGGRRSVQGIHPTHLRELDQLLVALSHYYVSLRIRERRRIGRHRALRDGDGWRQRPRRYRIRESRRWRCEKCPFPCIAEHPSCVTQVCY